MCWGLCLFDLVLGASAAIWPGLYLDIFHPHLETPQVELVQRTGMLWLAFSAVALRAATVSPDRRAVWFLVLGVLRLMEVPADMVYAATASGAAPVSLLLLWSAPPLNLALGGYLCWLSRRLFRAAQPSQRRSIS
jgi:hypothetical protein